MSAVDEWWQRPPNQHVDVTECELLFKRPLDHEPVRHTATGCPEPLTWWPGMPTSASATSARPAACGSASGYLRPTSDDLSQASLEPTVGLTP
jgi:hypothetical protein